MSDQFLRLVSRSAKFDARAAHTATRQLDLHTPQKAAAATAAAPSPAATTARHQGVPAALNFFAAPAAAAVSAAAGSPATPASKKLNGTSAASASKSQQHKQQQLSGKKRSRDPTDDDGEEEEEAAESFEDDGANDLEDAEEEEEEDDIALFGGAHAPKAAKKEADGSDDDEGEGGNGGPALSAAAARAKALKQMRRDLGIHVMGSEVPAPFRGFDDLLSTRYGVPEYIVRNLTLPATQDGCGYTTPTPIQQQAIPILLKQRELLACAPTGSGKTAAFVIPILTSLVKPGKTGKFRALVLSPVRELAEQTHRCFNTVGRGRPWKVMNLLKANASANAMSAETGSMAHAKRDVLIATPALLVHLIEAGSIDLSAVEWLVLDEADRLFEGGAKGFLEQLDAVMAACTHPRLRKALFSATMMQGVEQLARTVLRDPVRVNVGARNSATSSIRQSLLYVSSEEGKLVALRQMVQKGLDIPVLIFVQSKERAQQLYSELVYDNLQVDVIHADRTAAQRTASMQRFRSGSCWVLIATDLIARGIDIAGVKTVVNYDFPQSTVSYIHRIGRTGRAGREGQAVTFFTEADKPLLHSIAKLVSQSGSEVPEWMMQIPKIGTKKAKKLQEQAPPRAAIVPNPKNSEANKKARDRKKKRKLEQEKAKQKEKAAAAV